MSWFGPSIDLSSAMTVIEQLTDEKETLENKVQQLDSVLRQQRERTAACRQAAERAALEEAQARQMSEQADRLETQQARDHSRLQARLAESSRVLALAKDVKLISRAMSDAKDAIFPPALVFAGCDGVGKATIVQRLFEEFPNDFAEAKTETSRPPGEGEVETGAFTFVERQDMELAVREGRFVEVAEVGGHLYGTSLRAVSEIRNAGKICVMHIDLAGMEQLYSSGLECISIWVAPPNSQALIGRLERRGIRDKEEIMARVAASEEDERTARLRTDVLFDFHVVNDTVESAMANIRRILGNYRQFEGRVPGLTQEWRPRRSHRDSSAASLVPPVSGDGYGATSQGFAGGSLEGLTISEITRDPAKVEMLKDYLDNLGLR